MAQQNAAGWETPYKFTGKEQDPETGLYYFGARYYDPHISLWMSVDPLAEKYPGWSPYNYTLNNPVRLVDPDGENPIVPIVLLVVWLITEAEPVNAPGSDRDHVKFKQTQDEHNESIASYFIYGPGGTENKITKAIGAEVKKKVKNEIKEEVVKRVTPRKSTKEQVTKNQPRDSKGQMIDPNTKKPLKPGEIDLGHKPGNEWKYRAKMHKDKGSTRREVIEAENNPALYQWEDRTANRSHQYELKPGNYKTSKDK